MSKLKLRPPQSSTTSEDKPFYCVRPGALAREGESFVFVGQTDPEPDVVRLHYPGQSGLTYWLYRLISPSPISVGVAGRTAATVLPGSFGVREFEAESRRVEHRWLADPDDVVADDGPRFAVFSERPEVPEAFARFYDQLESLRQLADDWNGYGSQAPNEGALRDARTVLQACEIIGRTPDRVVASADDGVGVYLTTGTRYVLIECFNSGDIVAGSSDRRGNVRNIDVSSDKEAMEDQLAEVLSFLDG